MQKKVVRVITFSDKYAHSAPLFHRLQILTLGNIYTLKLLCFVYECVHYRPTKLFNSYFTPLSSLHDHATRKSAKGDLYVSKINTTQYGKRTAKYADAILWNSLPTTIRDSPSLNIFKKRLKDFNFSLCLE